VNVRKIAIAALLIGAVPACKKNEADTIPSTWANFECRNRQASYYVQGGMRAEEAGVKIDCESGPKVTRWLEDKGNRVEDSTSMTPGEFEDVWKRIDGVGWRHLKDCTPDVGDQAIPIYTFDIAKDDETATFQCEALTPEFPWGSLIQELDQLAATIQGDKGKAQVDIEDEELDKPQP
jgi:hypothetical protein